MVEVVLDTWTENLIVATWGREKHFPRQRGTVYQRREMGKHAEQNTIMATTVYTKSPSHDLEHLESLHLSLYFHVNISSAQWRTECKIGPQLD